MDFRELKERICKEAKLTEDELDERIEEKVIELSGLVSEEGAAYIVAKEEGLDLLEKRDLSLKIKNILPGLKAIDVVGKVVSVSDMREFKKGDRSGKVQNVMIGDETGSIRVVFWNDMVRLVSDLKEGDVIKVKRGFTRPNTFGMPEIHMGNTSSIEKSDREIEAVQASTPFREGSFGASAFRGERKPLDKIRENDMVEARAAIVSTSESEYLTCPKCDGRLEEAGGEYVCATDGKVEPKKNLIVKGYIDDGSAALRFVSFREVADRIKKERLEGKEMIFTGRIKKNEYFGNLEIVLNQVSAPNYEDEVEKLL
ncbi:MAG: OB-fold nucleic acid binding domain-containing protein [Candidatus Aenigmatarchaeota archaeon]